MTLAAMNPSYRRALMAPHAAYSRVEVWRAGVPVEELIRYDLYPDAINRRAPVFFTGSIRATLQSRVARTASLVVPDWLYPVDPDDLLNPYGNQLKIFRGVRYGSGEVDEFQVFAGPIERVKPGGNGTATLSASDLAYEVVGAHFDAPGRASVGSTITAEFERLVTLAYPSATFGRFDAITETVPELSYDYDRGAALDGLAKIAGAYWYTLANGDFVMRWVPWTVSFTTQPVVLASGDQGTQYDGNLVSGYPDRTRQGVYSNVVASSDNTDGGDAFSASVSDLDPTSPTFANGPFGKKTLQVRVTQAATQSAVYSAARTILRQSKALSESWTLEAIADASIELGDPLEVHYRGRIVTQVVAGYNLPLDPGSTMSIDGRGLVTGESEDVDA
jgi:hypothetical protein